MSKITVTKCDRCGNVIESYGYVSIKDSYYPYATFSADLCKECKEEFEKWLKK